jgi:tetratricopeptide (TPR) repeat protein
VDEAVACYRQAIELDPKNVQVLSNLGEALYGKGQVDEAIACFKKALAVDPKLGDVRTKLTNAERLAAVQDKLAAYLKGDFKPTTDGERLGLARWCQIKKHYHTSARLYADAFAADPKLADDLNAEQRYDAARSAVLATAGKGEDAAKLDDKEKARLRQQALDWLKADLALRRQRAQSGGPEEAAQARAGLASWQQDRDLASIRDKDALARLPAEDRAAFTRLWADVAALLPKAGEQPTPPKVATKGDEKGDEEAAKLKVDPGSAEAHDNLANGLKFQGKVDDAIASWRKAIEFDPKYAPAHTNLGIALLGKGQVEEAIQCFHKAIDLDPKLAEPHNRLGDALKDQGKVDEAIACWRKAGALDPKLAWAQNMLGNALAMQNRLAEAEEAYRKAIALRPKDPDLHFNLGTVLHAQRKTDEGAAAYREVIRLRPEAPKAHCFLGLILRDQGNFADALKLLRRGHEFGTKQPGWSLPSAEWVREAEQLVAVEAKLPAFLKGEFQPRDTAERLGLIGVCQVKKQYAAAARLYADAFAADPKLADDLNAQQRYDAARSAALAAAGKGEDAAKLDEKEKARLRKLALDWLRADLALRIRQLESGKPADRAPVQQAMCHWRQDSDLAGLRDAASLDRLPAEERAACEKLWADVAALLKKAEAAATQGKP